MRRVSRLRRSAGNTMLLFGLIASVALGQADSPADSTGVKERVPVTLAGDTVLFIQAPLGPFTVRERAAAIEGRLAFVLKQELDAAAVHALDEGGMTTISIDTMRLLAVSEQDAELAGITREALANAYVDSIKIALHTTGQRYSVQTLLTSAGVAALLLFGALLVFWLLTKLFPRAYDRVEEWEGTVIRPIRVRTHELVSAESITAMAIVVLKGVRLAISLLTLYLLITNTLSLFPWTRGWDVRPLLRGIFFSILTTAAAFAIIKLVNSFFAALARKVEGWKGTVIKPVRVKTVEVLSQDRIAELVTAAFKILQFLAIVVAAYAYVTLLFSFFAFSQTWAATLVRYIVEPLSNVVFSVVRYLPNLFFIAVVVYVTRFVIKFIKLVFDEIGKGSISLPGFYPEWAEPTYKIVRFLVFALVAVVIFPYLPGADSEFFKGVTVFIGILFSLGSTSAIANVVAGVVITYMRPFNIGDRVRIADTVGDVIEKSLLVTRVRTIKNVDVTIPNAMVLGSHIINFSSSAKERGLILHTSVTIGYDVPWKRVHQLLIEAAEGTPHILKDPPPFVLQTSLDDFYVNYEINALTDQPNKMASIYSELHQQIQDKFNEAGVEIMSPHYSALRDGNQTAIPQEHLPKHYTAPAFRIFPTGNITQKPDNSAG